MKGLLVWAQSDCRSTMALYEEIAKVYRVPLMVALWHYSKDSSVPDNRARVGFRPDEFSRVAMVPVGENTSAALRLLEAHRGWHHIFCVYHESALFRRLICMVKERGEKVAVFSESPCNMDAGFRRFLKSLYMKTLLRWKVRKTTQMADFFVSYSGDSTRNAIALGWAPELILPFGYFSPPLEGSRICKRDSNSPFEILSTGALTWHRGGDVLIRALVLLAQWGVAYHATITQAGPLADSMKKVVAQKELPVDFVGLLPLQDLVAQYQTCSVFVAAGRNEPWGIRLNDALQCGSPLVVSRGMGGCQLVDRYACGCVFEVDDAVDLATKLALLAMNTHYYRDCARNAYAAAVDCSPAVKAGELVSRIRCRFPEWEI